MKPLNLALAGPDLTGLLAPFLQQVAPGVAQASAPVLQEVSHEAVKDAISQSQPLVASTAATAARAGWETVPWPVKVGGFVVVASLAVIAIRGRA